MVPMGTEEQFPELRRDLTILFKNDRALKYCHLLTVISSAPDQEFGIIIFESSMEY